MLDISTVNFGTLLNLFAIVKTIHIIAVIVWIGGMFFAHICLRPVALQLLEPSLRVQLWAQVFARFFFWVWIAIGVLLVTGIWIIFLYGGMGIVRHHIHLMLGVGIVMIMVFMHIFFSPYRKLRQSVAQQNTEQAIRALSQIRWLVTLNLSLGLLTVAIAIIGKG